MDWLLGTDFLWPPSETSSTAACLELKAVFLVRADTNPFWLAIELGGPGCGSFT